MHARWNGICLLLLAGCAGSVSPGADTTVSTGGSGGDTDGSAGVCVSAVSHFPAGYVMNYQVTGPCDAHRSCMECLPGPTGMSECQWCGEANGSGACVANGEACPGGVAVADHWNGYCPEFCDQMDGASCDACTQQPDPYSQGCSWCPETQDCFSELAAQVGLQPAGYCAKTKAGANGVSCQDVPPLCSTSPAADAGSGSSGAGQCTQLATPAVSHFPAGYVLSYQVVGPCDAHRSCMECLAGPTGMSECQWCGDANGSGSCVAKGAACPAGIAVANHWNGYCPEFCDQMDGASCDACTQQPDPYNRGCSWCPETQDCFNELAAQVGLQPAGYCAKTKGGANGLSCQDVPPVCSP